MLLRTAEDGRRKSSPGRKNRSKKSRAAPDSFSLSPEAAASAGQGASDAVSPRRPCLPRFRGGRLRPATSRPFPTPLPRQRPTRPHLPAPDHLCSLIRSPPRRGRRAPPPPAVRMPRPLATAPQRPPLPPFSPSNCDRPKTARGKGKGGFLVAQNRGPQPSGFTHPSGCLGPARKRVSDLPAPSTQARDGSLPRQARRAPGTSTWGLRHRRLTATPTGVTSSAGPARTGRAAAGRAAGAGGAALAGGFWPGRARPAPPRAGPLWSWRPPRGRRPPRRSGSLRGGVCNLRKGPCSPPPRCSRLRVRCYNTAAVVVTHPSSVISVPLPQHRRTRTSGAAAVQLPALAGLPPTGGRVR